MHFPAYTGPGDGMDRMWTPWRYQYVTGADQGEASGEGERRKGVPQALSAWPGPDAGCVFCNLIASVRWARAEAASREARDAADRAGYVIATLESCFLCLNAFPYASGHVLIVPYQHTDSLAKLPAAAAEELIRTAQRVETALREVYKPHGINLGMNLGQAAGAGVAEHVHMHELPRWVGDTNFMTVTAETRVLPETLEITWERLREAFGRTAGA